MVPLAEFSALRHVTLESAMLSEAVPVIVNVGVVKTEPFIGEEIVTTGETVSELVEVPVTLMLSKAALAMLVLLELFTAKPT